MNFIDEMNSTTSPSPKKQKQSKSPRWEMFNNFVDHHMRHLSVSAVQVWLVLYRATTPSGLCSETIKQIADKAGITEPSVKRGLRELYDSKLFNRVSKGSLRRGPSIRRLLNPPSITSDTQGSITSDTHLRKDKRAAIRFGAETAQGVDEKDGCRDPLIDNYITPASKVTSGSCVDAGGGKK